MKKLEIPANFLHTTDSCYFCQSNEEQAKLRFYYKYSGTIKEVSNFVKKSKFIDQDPRLQEEFLMCDNCRMFWAKSPEAKQAFIYYRKIYQENRYQSEEAKLKQKALNDKNYLKRKQEQGETNE